jgi:hypothetical protein
LSALGTSFKLLERDAVLEARDLVRAGGLCSPSESSAGAILVIGARVTFVVTLAAVTEAVGDVGERLVGEFVRRGLCGSGTIGDNTTVGKRDLSSGILVGSARSPSSSSSLT